MSKVLLTGVAGFIGSHVARQLITSGHEVVGIDDLSGGFLENVPDGVCFYRGNICNVDLVDSIFQHHKPDYVMHLAAYAAEGLSHFIRMFNHTNNLIGSCNLINAAVKHGVKGFVFTSSMAVYGEQVPPFTEDMPTMPIDSYGISKAAVERELWAAHDVFGLPYVVARPYNIYGPQQNIGDPYRNVIGIFFNQLMQGLPMTIFGDGEQRRTFSYIDEIVPALSSVIDRDDCWGETFNIGGTNNYSISELATKVAAALSVRRNVIHLDARHEASQAWCSPNKAYEWFGPLMKPVLLDDGLARMAEWALKHGARKGKPFANIEITKNLPPKWAALMP